MTRYPSPKKGDIVTYDGYSAVFDGIYLKEYDYRDTGIFMGDGRPVFHPDFFRPLLGDSAKSELVSSFKDVTETSDIPIQIPEQA